MDRSTRDPQRRQFFARVVKTIQAAIGGTLGLVLRRDPEWLIAHVRDPLVIAPGLREPPLGGMNDGQARSIASYMRKVGAGVPLPAMSAETRLASVVMGRYCANCHMMDGEGESVGPDLTGIGSRRDAAWLRD